MTFLNHSFGGAAFGIVALAGAAFIPTPTLAADDFVSLGEHTRTFSIGEWTATVTGMPELTVSSDRNGITVVARASFEGYGRIWWMSAGVAYPR